MHRWMKARSRREQARVYAPLERDDGSRRRRSNTRLRRMVNDYLQPPKVTRKMEIGLQRFAEIARRHRRDQGRQPARTDARGGGQRDPRLRRNGSARLAVPHGEPLGSVPLSRRLSAAQRRRLVLPHTSAKDATGRMVSEKRAGRTVRRAARSIDDSRAYQNLRIGEPALADAMRSRSCQPHRTTIFQRSAAPVTIDEDKCIADKGCTVCVDVCPLDLLAIDLSKGKAYMKFDECWYCMPCEKDCPTGAVQCRHSLSAALTANTLI